MRMSSRRASVIASTAALGLALAACGSTSSSGSQPPAAKTLDGELVLNVVAGENFWGNVISQIGGFHVRVTSIISDPNTDPHEYESDTKDAASLARADFVLENGLGYDDFMAKLLAASPRSGRKVLSVQAILNITGADPNPHI